MMLATIMTLTPTTMMMKTSTKMTSTMPMMTSTEMITVIFDGRELELGKIKSVH